MKASKVVDVLAVVVTVLAVLDLLFLVGILISLGVEPEMHTLFRAGRIASAIGLGGFLWIVARALECLEVIAESSKDRCSDQTAKALLEELKILSADVKERKREIKVMRAAEAEAEAQARVAQVAGKYPGEW